MRVEPQHADLRFVAIDAANAPHRLRAEFERVENAFLREQSRHLRVGHVRGDKHTTHLVGILQHARARWAWVSSAKISVCPGNGTPAARRASLLSGAVVTAATCPLSAALMASSTYVYPARPVAALIVPVSKSLSAMALRSNTHGPSASAKPSMYAVGFVKPHCSAACSSTARSPKHNRHTPPG